MVAEVALATPVGENSLYHYEVPAAMLPPGLARHTVYEIERAPGAPAGRLTPRERAVLELVPAQGTIALERLTREGGKTAAGTVAGLVKRGVLRRHARLSVAAGPKTGRLAEWTGKEPEGRLGPKSGATLAVLKRAEGPMGLAELGRHVDGAGATLAGLQRRGLVRICEEVVRRDPISHRPLAPCAPPPLTAEQEGAVGAITTALHAR